MIVGKRCDEPGLWNEIVHDLDGHPLQLWGWGELKAAHNWRAHRVIFVDHDDVVVGAAQILSRKLPGPLKRLNYVARGPVWCDGKEEAVLDALAHYTKLAAMDLCLDEEGGGASEGSPVGSIAIKAWDPQTPYLSALRESTPERAYETYLRLRPEFRTPTRSLPVRRGTWFSALPTSTAQFPSTSAL